MGDDPCPGALVVGAHPRSASPMTSTDHDRFMGVAEAFQRSEHPVCASSSEISAVLKSDPTRADFSDEADGFKEQSRSLAIDTFALGIGAGDILAGRGPDNDIGNKSKVAMQAGARERADIIVESDIGVVLGIEGSPPIDDFTGCDGLETRAVHSERPAAGRSRKKIEHPKPVRRLRSA